MHDFTQLERSLRVSFSDKDLLTQAFTHRSYLNEHPSHSTGNNERLEFLGDAVLELVVTEFLYGKFPSDQEGKLTAYRASMVNTSMLANLGTDLGFEDYLLLSKGEAREHKGREYILANTVEAFIGALYIDSGYGSVKEFLERVLFPRIDMIISSKLYIDAKSNLQEVAQEKTDITPEYRLISEEGPDHDKHFKVAVYLGEEKVAEGEGSSKQDAEQDAARSAIEVKGWG